MLDRREFLGHGAVSASACIAWSAALTKPVSAHNESGPLGLTGDSELPWKTISELAKHLRTRAISSVDLTKFMLKRIEKFDPKYNSYINVMSDAALQDARRADRAIKLGKYRGPLHGIPVAVKDLCYTKGTVTTAGMAIQILAKDDPEYDATVVTRLR